MTELEILIRLSVSLLCGAAIGLEREWFKHPAGLRTFSLVCLASALAMVVQLYLSEHAIVWESVKVDPGRMPGQVLTGIGFIGAGLIMKNHDNVQGLTTAACIFITAVIGLAIGAGMIWTGVLTTAAAIILLVSSQIVRRKRISNNDKQ